MRLHQSCTSLWIALAAAASGAVAGLNYRFELPSSQVLAYTVPLELREAGRLVIEAEWTAERLLTLRLDGPAGTAGRRTGASPLRLEVDVTAEALSAGSQWTLSVRGLPSRHAGSGRLSVIGPAPPRAPEPVTPPLGPPPAAPALEPWQQRRDVPAGAAPALIAVFETTESFRALVVEPVPDACRWQADTLRYLAFARDARASASLPNAETRAMLVRIAEAISRVEQLRTSTDPLLQRPLSATAGQLEAWQHVFRERTDSLRSLLDDVLHDLHGGRAPELETEPWPARLMGCVIACERHFEEQRGAHAVGAANQRLASDQWERIRAAAAALAALAAP